MSRWALLLSIAVMGCHEKTSTAPAMLDAGARVVVLTPEAMVNAEVKTTQLQPGTFSPRLRTTATISGDSKSIARIGSRVPGRVAKVNVSLGDRVKKGQALVELDAAETHQVTLDLATAQARSIAANDALARQKLLLAERVGAEQDLRRAEAEATAASAALHEAREHLRFLGFSDRDVQRAGSPGEHAEHSIVRAPIDGQVAALDVSIGQVLLGNEDIVTVAQVDKLWVDLRIYERDLALVVRGSRVEVRVPAYPDRAVFGTLTFVGDLIDPVTRTVPARAALEEPGPLRPGMTATAFITERAVSGALWLPIEAVQKAEGEPTVFVRVGERRFEPRRIAVGAERGGFVPVRRGISAGSDVVTHGSLALRGELERAALEE